jgi:hypothetical protein
VLISCQKEPKNTRRGRAKIGNTQNLSEIVISISFGNKVSSKPRGKLARVDA